MLISFSTVAPESGKLNFEVMPYIVVITHPTTGGVTASYAMLGDEEKGSNSQKG